MMTLCPNKIETRVNCRVLNGFGSGQKSPEHLRTFSATFGKSSENRRESSDVAGKFSEIPSMTRQISHEFD